MVKNGSKCLKLNKTDMTKLGKGALIAVVGSLLTYGASMLPSIDFGSSTPLVAGIVMILINVGRKWVINNK